MCVCVYTHLHMYIYTPHTYSYILGSFTLKIVVHRLLVVKSKHQSFGNFTHVELPHPLTMRSK